jgi:uncharacterized iron-regulated membrane protein
VSWSLAENGEKTADGKRHSMKPINSFRYLHRWGAVVIAVPVIIVVTTGVLLLLKKELSWIQPATQKGSPSELGIGFDEILEISKTVPDAKILGWEDIDRLDVRPSKGMVKVRAKNRWEIQLDTKTGEILQVSVRRSDLIESIHDGSFFHGKIKLWLFLPSALVLSGLWGTGIYMFFYPRWVKRKRIRSSVQNLVKPSERVDVR